MCDFVHTFFKQTQEDEKWEYFLHKVWDNRSYSEFCEFLQTSQELQEMSDEDVETTLKMSMDILGNFNPNKEEGEV